MRVVQIGGWDSQSEKELIEELEEWNGQYTIGGVAFIGLNKPARIDALIVTPRGCTVVEVKGVRREDAGPIDVPVNGSWTSQSGPLSLRLHDGASNPLSQVGKYVWATKRTLEKELPSAFVNGLVLLVQHHDLIRSEPRSQVISTTPDIKYFDKDLNGIAATTLTRFHNNGSLRKYFHQQSQRKRLGGRDWDVESVLRLFEIFGLTDGPTPEELAEEGFRPRSEVEFSVSLPRKEKPAPPIVRPRRDVASTTATAGVPTPAPAPRTAGASTTPFSPTPSRVEPPTVAPPPPSLTLPSHPVAGTSGRSNHTLRNVVLGAVLCCLLLAGYALVHALTSDHRESKAPAGTPIAKTISTPSRNIVCTSEGKGVRCDIDRVFYGVPPTPARCRGTANWGHTFALADGSGHLECPASRMKVSSTANRPIRFGQSATFGSSVCTSHENYLQCVQGRHGFRIAKAKYHVW